MAERKEPDNIFETVGAIGAAIIFGPIFVLIVVASILEAITPALPFLIPLALAGGGAFAYSKYENSPFTIRRRHEHEILDLLTRAEVQQQALPRTISDELSWRGWVRTNSSLNIRR